MEYFGDVFCGRPGEPAGAGGGVVAGQVGDVAERDLLQPFTHTLAADSTSHFDGFIAAGGIGETSIMRGGANDQDVCVDRSGRLSGVGELGGHTTIVEAGFNGFGNGFGVAEVAFVHNERFHIRLNPFRGIWAQGG